METHRTHRPPPTCSRRRPRVGSGAVRTSPARVCSALIAALLLAACGGGTPAGEVPEALVGDWRAVLESPGGELPFTLSIRPKGPDETLQALAHNGDERAPFSSVRTEDERVVLEIDWYDSRIEATLGPEGRTLTGSWSKTAPEGESRLPFRARRGEHHRFAPAADGTPAGAVPAGAGAAAPPAIGGSWAVVFTDEGGEEKALGEFEQDGDRVTGTFLTPTGDYRYLEGDYREGRLRLSCFDGAHAFLFLARVREDGILVGDFWSRDSYHATWTARRLARDAAGNILPDPFGLVQLTNEERRFDFSLPDLEGRPLSLSDPRFEGKVVLVNLFGSWCPNCNDEAPLLARWYRQYHPRGLEIVGLAFEMTGDPERDAIYVHRFADRHRLDYPMVLAGDSDKAAAAALFEDLDRVVAYPTTIFLGRDGRVRRIHSGFAGPGTGEHHERTVRELEGLIEELLDEPPPEGPSAGAAEAAAS